jgi:hypothetical protein
MRFQSAHAVVRPHERYLRRKRNGNPYCVAQGWYSCTDPSVQLVKPSFHFSSSFINHTITSISLVDTYPLIIIRRMCRLPVELMARIIELSRRPLPPVPDDDWTSKWKDLCQPELATLMRTSRVSSSRCCRLSYNQELIFQMTYFLTAPILYKEAVIGSFESFFHGYDAPLPTNQRSVHRPSNQPRICEMVTRDNEPYRCLQHPIQTPNKIEIADSDWDKFQSPSFISEHCLIWSMLSISSTRLGMRSFCLQLIQ